MKITIEFNSVEEYLEFKEKTAQEEQCIHIVADSKKLATTNPYKLNKLFNFFI